MAPKVELKFTKEEERRIKICVLLRVKTKCEDIKKATGTSLDTLCHVNNDLKAAEASKGIYDDDGLEL